jgi:hypothetical protein
MNHTATKSTITIVHLIQNIFKFTKLNIIFDIIFDLEVLESFL